MLEELYLVRHAAPNRSLSIPYHTLPGPPLTPLGEHEAAQAANWLAGRRIEHLFASPFARTRATAETIAARAALPLTFAEALRESVPGESHEQISARMAELLAQLDDGSLRRVVLVTHGAPILALLKHTTGDRIDLSGRRYDYGNCSPTAGIWHGIYEARVWRWELAFHPAAPHEGST